MRTASASRAARTAATEAGGGRHLDELLVAALEAALALPQVADAAACRRRRSAPRCGGPAAISSSANNVPSPNAEAASDRQRSNSAGQLVGGRDDATAAAAAAGGRLEDQGRAGTQRVEERVGSSTEIRPACPGARARRPARPDARAAALSPNSASTSAPGRRSVTPASAQRAGERRVLAEEAVARVDRVGAGLGGDLEHAVDVEVGGGPGPAERARHVRLARVERRGIVVGVDGDGPPPQLGGGAEHADRDLPAVGDQQRPRRHRCTIPSGVHAPSTRCSRRPAAPGPYKGLPVGLQSQAVTGGDRSSRTAARRRRRRAAAGRRPDVRSPRAGGVSARSWTRPCGASSTSVPDVLLAVHRRGRRRGRRSRRPTCTAWRSPRSCHLTSCRHRRPVTGPGPLEPRERIELSTYALRVRCSTD